MDKKEIKRGLSELGLKRGDSVILHSSFTSLGNVEEGPDAVIDAFLEVLGTTGTLVVPAFGALGILADTLKNRPGAVKSCCNGATVAALGSSAEKLCHEHWKAETLHGENTPYKRLAEIGGYVCLLGVDQDRNTTLHSVEALLELAYLKNHSSTFTDENGKTRHGEWKYFPGPHRDFIGLDRFYRESGKMKVGRIGNAVVRLIKAKDLIEIGLELGKKSPDFALCDNPNCEDCVLQRAAIFGARIRNSESFSLAAAMRLAGRYIPEAVDNLKDTGISLVELDFIDRSPAGILNAGRILDTVKEFTEEGITVSGLRMFHVPDTFTGLFSEQEVIKAVRRLVLPLSECDTFATDALKAGWKVDFFNQSQTAMIAATRIKKLHGGMVFNPANFASIGEKPFLKSFGTGRFIRTISALDIVDGLFDGTPTSLGCGNGEIKELISILRCHSFQGIFTLGGGSVFPGSLRDARKQFEYILDTI